MSKTFAIKKLSFVNNLGTAGVKKEGGNFKNNKHSANVLKNIPMNINIFKDIGISAEKIHRLANSQTDLNEWLSSWPELTQTNT